MSGYYEGGSDKTIAKLVILRKYLWAYEQIMENNWNGERWYVDTHSGTGLTDIDDHHVKVRGSALRALDCNFDGYYFYEYDEDHFELLCETIEKEHGVEFSHGYTGDTEHRRASCEDPKIHVLNMDCNEGLSWLIENSSDYRHWFAFIDPEKLSVKVQLLNKLIERGNTDILINFQTTAYQRAGAEGAEHAHPAVTEALGEDWPVDADRDAYVQFFREQMFDDTEFDAVSRKMISEGAQQWRYDMVFASAADVAESIMSQIMSNNLKDDVSEEIMQARERNGSAQSGIEQFSLTFSDHKEQGQKSLADF